MTFLRYMNSMVVESSDDEELSDSQVKIIQKQIKKGVELSGEWDNALELVNKAYKVAGIELPTASEINQWKQYETMINYGVIQLSKAYGTTGDWRITSESLDVKKIFRVIYEDSEIVVESESIDDIISTFDGLGYRVVQTSKSDVILEFWEYGVIRANDIIRIHELVR